MNVKLSYSILLLSVFACRTASSQQRTSVELLQNAPITGIVVSSGLDTELRMGDTPGLRMEVDDRLEPYLVCELSPEGILACRYSKVPSLRWKGSARPDSSELKYVAEGNVDPRGGRMYRRGRMIVTVKTLKNLILKDGAFLIVKDRIHADSCKIELRGKPRRFRMHLDAGHLDLCGKSASGLKRLTGDVATMYVSLKNSEISLPRLDVKRVSGTLLQSTLRCTATQFDKVRYENSCYIGLR